MDPISISLGAVVAALVVKATNRAEDTVVDAGASAISKIIEWLRSRLSGGKDSALERLEDAPDSPSREKALADQVDAFLTANPALTSELQALVAKARAAEAGYQTSTQSVTNGSANVQNAHIHDSTVTTSFGSGAGQPPV